MLTNIRNFVYKIVFIPGGGGKTTCLPRLNRAPPEWDLFRRVVNGIYRTERRCYFMLLIARRARNRDPVPFPTTSEENRTDGMVRKDRWSDSRRKSVVRLIIMSCFYNCLMNVPPKTWRGKLIDMDVCVWEKRAKSRYNVSEKNPIIVLKSFNLFSYNTTAGVRARKRIHANRRCRLHRLQLDRRSRPAVAPRRNIEEEYRAKIIDWRRSCDCAGTVLVMVRPTTKRPRRNTVFLIKKYISHKCIRL